MSIVKILKREIAELERLISNRERMVGDYDKNADYSTALAELKQELWEKKDYLYFPEKEGKMDRVKCVNCGHEFVIPEPDSDQPDASYSDPTTHGVCPNCEKRFDIKE